MVLGDMADYDRALAQDKRSLAIFEATLGPSHPLVATALNNLGNAYLQSTRFALARALWLTGGDRSRARQLAEGARDLYAASAKLAAQRASVETWLAAHAPARR